jgi:hypothetical protein
MNCQRCQGLLIEATCSDFFCVFHVWRCFNCGAVTDRTISSNRRDAQTGEDAPHTPRRWLRRPPLSMSQT